MKEKCSHEEIMRFINKFKYGFNKSALEVAFTQGNCYHFSLILNSLYEGEIYYDQVICHFMFKVDGEFYDITGKIPIDNIENATNWESLKSDDKLHCKHIKRDCIYKREFGSDDYNEIFDNIN